MTRPPAYLAALVLVPALFVAACGTPTTASEGAAAVQPTSAPVAAQPTVAAAEAAADHTDWPEEFHIGLFAGDDANATMQNAEPLRKYMEERLGIPVKVTTGTSYSAVIEAMRANRVDAMEVGPFSYTLAVQEAGAQAIAVSMNADDDTPVYDPDVAPAYYSVIITKKGSGINTVEDVKGKSFAFVDPASTSGHLAPKTKLIKLGIDPDKDMKTVFAGSHPTSVLSVWNGNVQAGATYEGNLYKLAREGQIKFCGFADGKLGKPRTPEEIQAVFDACPDGNIAVLSYSDPIPNTPFAVNSTLPESFKTAVRDALLATKDNPEFIKDYKQWYIDPSQELGLPSLDAYYNPLRDIAKLLNLDLKELGG